MKNAIGVDLGGTKLAAGVVDADGRVLRREEVPSRLSGPQTLTDLIAELIGRLTPEDPVGCGVGAAGIIEFADGRYVYGPNTGLRDLELATMLSKEFGMPVRVDNDANCAAWAEHRFGAGRGTRQFLCITLGTGIGGGIVAEGRPYRGASGAAAEVGHMLVDPDGPLCGCGRRGCWEQFASGLALERMAREQLPRARGSLLHDWANGDPEALTGRMVTRAAREGDGLALKLVEHMGRWVGWGLASLVNILEPERVAVAGGLAAEWELFGATATEAMRERVEAPEHRYLPEVVPAALGADSGVIGAAWLMLGDEP